MRPVVGVLAATTLVMGLIGAVEVFVTPQPARAAAVTDFEAGYIISDSVMYDSSTMGAAAIQAFLNTTGAGCTPAAGNTCLKAYVESTPNRPGNSLCKGAYAGASNDTAAQIIAKVSVACGINPQVLIVTLQKEQGLVTASAGMSSATYARALGFGCPDSAAGWCDPQYAGFANQVYSAASQLQRYAANPSSYSYRAGRTNTILWNPNPACGSSSVYIANQATASLYDYTPYQPNSAALAAGYGTGDSCSSYGNRNFHLYFRDWFGSATQRPPFGVVDLVANGGGKAIHVAGWAIDPDVATPIQVHVYVDGVATAALTASVSRPDVAAAYGRGADHGFDASVPAAPGTHTVCLYGIDGNGGTNALLDCRGVDVVNRSPVGVIDDVRAAGPSAIEVRGWAFDPDITAPIDVHVYVDGVATVALTALVPRPDVDAVYHDGVNHGYDVTFAAAAGSHSVCLYGIDGNGGTNDLLGCRTVDAINHSPVGVIDDVRAAGPSAIQVRGWALDPDITAPIGVHVVVDGVAMAPLTALAPRPDVDAVYHDGVNHGYDATFAATAGSHSVCLYGIDGNGGTDALLGCRTVDVVNRSPVGVIDDVRAAGPSAIEVRGWAFDPDITAPIDVHVYVDGVATVALTALAPRPDVDAVYHDGVNHGYDVTFAATAGSHSVCLYGIDGDGGTNDLLGCRVATVP